MAKKSFWKKLTSVFKPKRRSKRRRSKGFGQVDPTTIGIGAVVAVGLAAIAAKRKRDAAKAAAAAAAAQAAADAGMSEEEIAAAAAAASAAVDGGGGGGGGFVEPLVPLPTAEVPGTQATDVPGTIFTPPEEEVPTNGGTAPPPPGPTDQGFTTNGRTRPPLVTDLRLPSRVSAPVTTTTITQPTIRATAPVRSIPPPSIPLVTTAIAVPSATTVSATTVSAPAIRPLAIRAPLRGLGFTVEEADPLPPLTNMGFTVMNGSLVAVPTQVLPGVPRFRSPRRPTLVRSVMSPVIGTTSKTTQVLNESQTTALRTLRALRGFGGIGRCGVEEV